MSVSFKIDGKLCTAEAGEDLVVAAAKNGYFIPTLCYQPNRKCLGTCRVCSIKSGGKVHAGCTFKVQDGLELELDTPELTDMRHAMIELLFTEGNHYCPSCEKSGRCDLQAIAREQKMAVPRFGFNYPSREKDYSSEKILLERDRCIFCQRCVEFIRDKETAKKIFAIKKRGSKAAISMDIDLANKMSAEQIKEAVEICPVGAILAKGQGFDEAIGTRKYDMTSVREYALKNGGN